MLPTRSNSSDLTLGELEETAASARNGFACLFSSSDEYEAALISERRAAGRYAKPNPKASAATPFFERLSPMIAFWGCAFAIAAVVLLAMV